MLSLIALTWFIGGRGLEPKSVSDSILAGQNEVRDRYGLPAKAPIG